MTSVVLGLLLRAVVVLTGTALATFTLLWHAPGDPALAIAMARYDSIVTQDIVCLLYTSPSPRDGLLSRMPSSA